MSTNLEHQKVLDTFYKKHGNMITHTPYDVIDHVAKRLKKEKALDFNKHSRKYKKDINFLNLSYDLFERMFVDGELIKLKKKLGPIVGPIIINVKNEEENRTKIIFLKNNKLQVKNAFTFAIYDWSSKRFMWVFPDIVKDMCKRSINSNMSFCKYKVINNIESDQADQLALWFRTMIYFDKHVDNISWLGSDTYFALKTQNFITFRIEHPNKKNYTIYTLADCGIKDLQFNEEVEEKFDFLKSLLNKIEQITFIKKFKGEKLSKNLNYNKIKK